MIKPFFFNTVREIVVRTTTFQNTNIAQTISLIEGGQQVLAAYQELIMEEDVDFEQSFQWLDGSGNYIPLNTDSNVDFIIGISYRGSRTSPQLKKQHTVDSNIFTVGSQGIFTISLPRETVNAIDFERAFYSIKCYYKGKWYRLIEGPILLSTESALID